MWLPRFFAAPENFVAPRRGGYDVQTTEVVGGWLMVQNLSAEIAFSVNECDLYFCYFVTIFKPISGLIFLNTEVYFFF